MIFKCSKKKTACYGPGILLGLACINVGINITKEFQRKELREG